MSYPQLEAFMRVAKNLTEVEHVDGNLTRFVHIRPEFDCLTTCHRGKENCYPGSPHWHGIGARQLFIGVKVEGQGAVVQQFYTPIHTEAVVRDRGREVLELWGPLGGTDLHRRVPTHEEQTMIEGCEYTGGDCYMDGTMMQVERATDLLIEGGVTAVWSWLGEAWLPELVNHA